MLRNDYPGQVCSIARSLEIVGERWSLLIVRDVMNGHRRFDQLQKALWRRPQRAQEPTTAPDQGGRGRAPSPTAQSRGLPYFLSQKGLDLWPALIALLSWGDRYSPGPEGPPMLIVHKECGGAVSDRGICESCGKVLHARDTRGPARPPALEVADRDAGGDGRGALAL